MKNILFATVTGLASIMLAVPATPVDAQDPTQRIENALAQAGEAGLPIELLQSKVAEGRAKGISMARIAAAIEQRAQAMGRARDVLARAHPDRTPAGDEIAVGADALQAGVSTEVLRQVAATSGPERRTVAIAALTHLVTAGQVPEAALARVREALARGNEALMNLPAVVGAGGGPPPGVPAAGKPQGTGRPTNPGKPGGKPGGGGG